MLNDFFGEFLSLNKCSTLSGPRFFENVGNRMRERFISSHDIGCIFSYKLRYYRQTCGAYMVNTDLLPAAPQIAILSSFFLAGLPDSKSQLMEQIVLSIMMFCLGGSHQSLKIFCFNWIGFSCTKNS